MKVYIGPYKNWFGPYQLAEKVLFWKDKHNDHDYIHKFGDWLAGDYKEKPSWLYRFMTWVDSKKKRKVNIHIDNYDAWNADHTLALIIHPLLKKLKENKHGSPYIDDEDVPEHLRSTAAPPKKNEYDTDENHHKRWEWVLDEMIWAFEQHADTDWDKKFYSGNVDLKFVKVEGTEYSKLVKGPNDTFKVDEVGKKAALDRMDNGRRLFAKYYTNLWD